MSEPTTKKPLVVDPSVVASLQRGIAEGRDIVVAYTEELKADAALSGRRCTLKITHSREVTLEVLAFDKEAGQ